MKKGRTLLIFTSVLVVFIAAYLLVGHFLGNTDGDETITATTYVSVTETDPADIRSISYVYEGETYSFEWNGSAWLASTDSKMPIDQTRLGEMASAISVIMADRHLSKTGADNPEYGFDNPDFTIEVTYSDGGKLTYYLGSINSHTGDYYFSVKGKDDVWMVNASLADYFSYTYKSLLTVDSMESIGAERVTKLSAVFPDGRVRTLEKSTATAETAGEDGDEAVAETASETEAEAETEPVTVYIMTNEAGAAAKYDKDAGLAAIYAFTSAPLTPESCVCYYTDENTDFSAYGLEEPITLTITYEKDITITAESSSSTTITKEYTYTLKLGVVYPENSDAEAETEPEAAQEASENTLSKPSAYIMLPDSVMIFSIDIQNADILIY